MSFFKKKPSKNARLVQELQAALSLAEKRELTLQNQLQKEREDKTSLEMALNEANHRSKELQETLDVFKQALKTSKAEVESLQAQNTSLHEENSILQARVCQHDCKTVLLQLQEMDDQKDHFKMVIESLQMSYGQLKVSNRNLLDKVNKLEGQLDQAHLLSAQRKHDFETLQNQVRHKIQELKEGEQRSRALLETHVEQSKVFESCYSTMMEKVHEMEEKRKRLEDEKLSMKAAAVKAENMMTMLCKQNNRLCEELEKQHSTNQGLQLNLEKKDEIIRGLEDANRSLQGDKIDKNPIHSFITWIRRTLQRIKKY